ncbi:hypothetical protein [Mycoplasma procyoni]|uniref:hypothetical protein n=1 Tax=Mycoplasma procyoni TaxID=568784 RepID=UPI00197BC004|nr:hypothetical protein [Mycoplasma procyoni]MBN3534611.1 hypothetical protein [Mycoplasma procyoni]
MNNKLTTLKKLSIALIAILSVGVALDIIFWIVNIAVFTVAATTQNANGAVAAATGAAAFSLLSILFTVFLSIALLVVVIIAFVKYLDLKKENYLVNLFGLWIATLVLVIVGLLLGWIPLAGTFIKIAALIVPIVTGAITISQIKKLN